MKNFFKPTLQTTYGKNGNCLSACIATLFDINIKDVPFILNDEDLDWSFKISNWFKKTFNKYTIPVQLADVSHINFFNNSFIITSINSDHPEIDRHAVITKGTNIVFDPMLGIINKPLTEKMQPTFLIIGDIRSEEN